MPWTGAAPAGCHCVTSKGGDVTWPGAWRDALWFDHLPSSVVRLIAGLRRCRGGLLRTLQMLDEEEDINKVLDFFSYEHFYVIYCKVRLVRSKVTAIRTLLAVIAF